MGTHLQLQAGVFALALTFFVKGALTLECYSCIDLADGGCSQEKIKKVTCPASNHFCVETLAAVGWSHGEVSFGEKGCGLSNLGNNKEEVDVHGILAFSQLHQCNSSLCNSKLDIESPELQTIGNELTRVPNGVECYSCTGDECLINNATIVKCYDSFRGCFHGNATMRAGNFSLTRPIKGCVKDKECTRITKGSPGIITLTGSCCSESLCNINLSNKTHFSAKIPRLAILPNQGSSITAATTATTTKVPGSMAASSIASRPTRSIAMTPPMSDHHNHDHDHDHNHVDTEITSVRDGKPITFVRVEERNNQQAQLPQGTKGSAAGLGGSAVLVLLLAGLLL